MTSPTMPAPAAATAPRSTIVVCGPSPQAVGGGPAHVRNLWASPLAREFELVLFEAGSRGRESPARDEPLPLTLLRLAIGPFVLAWTIATKRPAVVHLNGSVDTRAFWREWTHLVVAKLFGVPVVYQIHGGSLPALAASAPMRAITRAVYRWPDAMVVLASIEREQFAALGARRLTVVPNAVNVASFGGATRTHAGRVRRLGYLGRLVDGKGLMEAIAAVDALRREPGFEALELRLAGSGLARPRLEAEVARRGLAGAVTFVGQLQGEATAAFLRESDLFLLPSESEGLPYSVIEALASGTPVVATPVGGIPDIVRDGTHGRLVPPRDAAALAAAIRDLAADPARLTAMSATCVAWARSELGLERLARQFAALYRELGAR